MNNATRIFTQTFGTFMALAGIEHGIGEVLQGNTKPAGVMILSWPESTFYSAVGGEPALTLIPNMLVSGIVTIIVSLALLAWVLLFVQRKHGGLIMVLISLALLLVGGGIFPPILAMLAAIAGGKINSPLTWWRKHLSIDYRRLMSRLWLLFYWGGILTFLAMLPGLSILSYFFGIDGSVFILVILCCMLLSLALAMLTGFARDSLVERTPEE